MSARPTPQQALIYAMITTAAVDRSIADAELRRIRSIVKELPAFRDFEDDWMVGEAERCGRLLAKPNGLTNVLDFIRDGLPPQLYETAYVFAAEVAATDLRVEEEEVRFLELLAEKLEIDALVCAALERAAKARHQKV